jgi:hypothetical protein
MFMAETIFRVSQVDLGGLPWRDQAVARGSGDPPYMAGENACPTHTAGGKIA